MLIALVDNVDDVISGGSVVSLSTHPDEDRAENRYSRLSIVDYAPLWMALLHFPLAVLVWISRALGRSGRLFLRTRQLRLLDESAVVADLAGISFSDGRGVPTLIYNSMMTGIPLLLGRPVVKCSQAMGPFDYWTTRHMAKLVLPKVSSIVARGSGTQLHLVELGLENVVAGADLAFVMDVDERSRISAGEAVAPLGDGEFFVVSGSSVVETLCQQRGIDYVALMADLVSRLISETGSAAVLVSHSAQLGRPRGRLNDLPVMRDIAAAMNVSDGSLLLLDQSLDPQVLRSLIARGRFLLASRFHAMISGLATATPTVVVGWSHKYREVMQEFGQEDFVVPFESFTEDTLVALSLRAWKDADRISNRIAATLGDVQEQSRVSLTELKKTVHD